MPSDLTDVIAVESGYSSSIALKSDGTVVCWGNNDNGQCNGASSISDLIEIKAGSWYHTLGLKSDGTVVTWGLNDHGQTNVPGGLELATDFSECIISL